MLRKARHQARGYQRILKFSLSDAGKTIPGAFCTVVIAIAATYLARFAPLLGAPVIAIVIGVALRSPRPLPQVLNRGLTFSARYVLQLAIVVSGLSISLGAIVRTGIGTLPVTLVTIAVALVLARVLGRILGLDGHLRELIGIGTAICGASAIAAVSTVLAATEAESALAISVIFFYNIVAVLVFPPIGHALALTQSQFGVWAGTAINDTSSVVAAGFAYGREAGGHATIVKLTRAMLILPIVGILAIVRARAERGSGAPIAWRAIVPWFILWFLAAAGVDTLGAIPQAWHTPIADAATFLICMALAAIGLQTALRSLLLAGAKPLGFGLVLWLAVALSSLAIQHALHM